MVPPAFGTTSQLTSMAMGELATQAGQKLSRAGRKTVAVAVLIGAAYLLFKVVIGFVTGLVWVAVAVIAVVAVIWAVRTL